MGAKQEYAPLFLSMAKAFDILPDALHMRLNKCKHPGGYRYGQKSCSDLMLYYAQKHARSLHKGQEITYNAFLAYVKQEWLLDSPFYKFVEERLAEIKEEFMMQYAEYLWETK